MTTFKAFAMSLAAAGAILFTSGRPANAQWYGWGYPNYSYTYGYGYPNYSAYGAVGGPYVTPAPEFGRGAYHVTYPSSYSYSYSPGYLYGSPYPAYYSRPGYYSFFRY
jgi:hypothetical protein